MTLYSFFIFQKITNQKANSNSFLNFIFNNKAFLLITLIGSFILNLYFLSSNGILYLFSLSPLLIIFVGFHGYNYGEENPMNQLIVGYRQAISQLLNVIFVYLIISFMAMMIYYLSMIAGSFFTELILTNLPEAWKNAQNVSAINFFFFSSFPFFLAGPLFIFSQGLLFYCHKEKFESINLSAKLLKLGKKKDKYGF